MGKQAIINENQSLILSAFGEDPFLTSTFYFTGGTALSEVYLKHRKSMDLDFFSRDPFDAQKILSILSKWSKRLYFRIRPQFVDPTYIYVLQFDAGEELKVDFAPYAYRELAKKTLYRGVIQTDSLLDIGANKLLAVSQRSEVKDFVDLFFLLKQFSFWELRDGVKSKFNVELEPYLVATDFTVVSDFTFLPTMVKPLTLDKLKAYFQSLAKKLGKSALVK